MKNDGMRVWNHDSMGVWNHGSIRVWNCGSMGVWNHDSMEYSYYLFLSLSLADSGVGAGIDSYYEYCLKSYILLGDTEYLHRFTKVGILHTVEPPIRDPLRQGNLSTKDTCCGTML